MGMRKLELAGVAEAAQILGVTRQRVSQLCDTKEKGFPEPVAQLACGSIWLAADLRFFATHWDHKPGRPSRKVPDDD